MSLKDDGHLLNPKGGRYNGAAPNSTLHTDHSAGNSPLVKDRQWKELAVASVLLAAGFILSVLIMYDIDFPFLAPVISNIMEKWVALPGS